MNSHDFVRFLQNKSIPSWYLIFQRKFSPPLEIRSRQRSRLSDGGYQDRNWGGVAAFVAQLHVWVSGARAWKSFTLDKKNTCADSVSHQYTLSKAFDYGMELLIQSDSVRTIFTYNPLRVWTVPPRSSENSKWIRPPTGSWIQRSFGATESNLPVRAEIINNFSKFS